MGFVADQLFNDQKIRALTVVYNFSRESLAITVDIALKAADVVATMLELVHGGTLVDSGLSAKESRLDRASLSPCGHA